MTYEELGTTLQWKKNLLFAGVFIQENMLHAVFDRYNEMSCKQWLLLSVLKAFKTPPDLSTVARAMGCSRQNVKQLARPMEKEGYITMERSVEDARSLCISFTEKGKKASRENTAKGEFVHEAIFREFSDEEIETYFALSVKMMHGIEHLEKAFQQERI
ncbi:MAG: winged helix DNA-binding protein [Eubacteriales bacterium]|nr:winged helix DNA-binding protein [Eubacteriales bacterium]